MSIYQGNAWSAVGSDALAGAGRGALQGAVGGFTRGYYQFARACFAAGTPLLVDLEGNSRLIEDLEVGDVVLARSEFDPTGPLELKRIEEKFVRTSSLIELVVRGRSIKTTAEHPFYVPAQGKFIAAGELKAGEELVGHSGQLLRVDSLSPLADIATVYNFRVADHHTYFVGCDEWGFSVWAHNSYKLTAVEKSQFFGNTYRIRGSGALDKQFLKNNGFTDAQITTLRAEARSRGLLPATNRGRGGHTVDTRPTLDALDAQFSANPRIQIDAEVQFEHFPGRLSQRKSHRAADRVYTDPSTGEVTIVQVVRRNARGPVPREIDAVGDILASRTYADMVRGGATVRVQLIEAGTGHEIPEAQYMSRLDSDGYRVGSKWQRQP